MASELQDYTTLSNPRSIFYAALHVPFPEWVANKPMPSGFEKLASTAFADPARRLLPILDKEATFHSAIDYFANADKYSDEVGERLLDACQFFKVAADVAPYAELFAGSFEKSASAPVMDGKFAISESIGGQDYKLLPLNDADDVLQSARGLAKMAAERRIHFLMLRPAAIVICKEAGELGLLNQLPDLVSRIGEERLVDFEKAASLIADRGRLSKTIAPKVAQENYDAVLKEAADGTITSEECIAKIAAIDSAIGLDYKYHRASPVPLPSDIVLGGPLTSVVEKAAKEHVAVGEQVIIPLREFQRIDRQGAAYRLSKSAYDSLSRVIDSDDAKDISVAVMGWEESDRKTLLRLATSANLEPA